ncbi:MAG: inositol monophosphatase family protein [Candidatus Poriferisodalaceae bacterium]
MKSSTPNPTELKHLHSLAVVLARQAAEVHVRRETGFVTSKSTATDPISDVDREAETLIVTAIRESRPKDGIIGEEETSIEGTSGFCWVIDPLDGTVNYLYEFPSHAVSIGVEFNGTPAVGVVYDTALNEIYSARINSNATKNGREIQVTSCSNLALALLGTGFAYEPSVRRSQAELLTELIPQVRDIRRSGSCAVDLCSVASGRLDAFFETGVHWWDVAAGIQVVRSAGGIATYEPEQKRIIASGPNLWKQLNSAVVQAETVTGPQSPPESANI